MWVAAVVTCHLSSAAFGAGKIPGDTCGLGHGDKGGEPGSPRVSIVEGTAPIGQLVLVVQHWKLFSLSWALAKRLQVPKRRSR